jgi:hypothetical protein
LEHSSRFSATLASYELRFQSLFNARCGYVFPCDAQGKVAIDELCERRRDNYLYARAMVGRELSTPVVLAVA